MYVKDGVFRAIRLRIPAPIPEGAVLTEEGTLAAADGSDAFGILTEPIEVIPPTGRAYVAIGGTIDMESPVNADVDIPVEMQVALSDFKFVPGGPAGGGGVTVAGVSAFAGRVGNVMPKKGDYGADKIKTADGNTVQDAVDSFQNLTTFDNVLSPSSEKAVQNKVVTRAINDLSAKTMPSGGASGQLLAKNSGSNYDVRWVAGDNFMKKSDYDQDSNGRVDTADTAYSVHGPTAYTARLKNTQNNTYLITDEEKGARNGVAPLDSNKKILPEYMPDGITAGLTYGGIFNATTRVVRLTPAAKSILGVTADTMTLQNSSSVPSGYPANAELFYVTTVAGTFAGMDFSVGDWLISLGTEWQQLHNGAAVSSVNSKTGAVDLNTDDITEGVNNLYMQVAERQKLQNIEAEATKDVNVVQTAAITTLPSGTRVLRLTNKNGTVTDFEGASVDMDDYVKTDGNASQTFVLYTQGGARQTFNGSEVLELFHKKVVDYLNALEAVAFSGSYNDLTDRPTRTSQFVNDGAGAGAYVTAQVNNLANYYLKGQTYTRTEVDNLINAIEGFDFIKVNVLPTTNIDDSAIYYVPSTGGTGYTRWQHMGDEWLNLGTTDVDMTEYLKVDGDGSAVTATFTMAAERAALTSGDTLADVLGDISKWLYDLKAICFTGSWQSLEDAAELATQDDLDDYVLNHYTPADEGKVLAVDGNGDVRLQALSDGAVRKGAGAGAIIANDSAENPKNTADGAGASAFGEGTRASGSAQMVYGRYNVEDSTGNFVEVAGGGDSSERKNIKTTDWNGNGWYNGKLSVGNTTDNIVTPENGNDLTTKRYVDNVVDTKIAEANLLKSMVVTVLPAVEDADANILYLVEDPTHEDTYLTFKKVLESQNPDVWIMASIGSTQITTSTIQATELPTPSVAFNNAVYQYIGSGSEYHYGRFYSCKPKTYYAWLGNVSAKTYYTDSATPAKYAKMYRDNLTVSANWVMSSTATTLTDNAANTYTRLSASDLSTYAWMEIDSKLSEFTNDGTGTGAPDDYFITKKSADAAYNPNLTAGTAISSVTDSTKISQVTLSTDKVADMTALSVFQYIAKKIYPVGAVYVSTDSTSPGTLFGGTWTQIGDGYYLRASSSGAGNTLSEQLPNVTGSFRFTSGSQGHPEVSSPSGAFRTATNGNLTYPWPTDGTSGGPRTVNFSLKNFNENLYVDNGVVQPKSFKVYMWRRTA